jgi:hypothetical protein
MAISALSFLAADRDRLERFLSVTGLAPHSLRAAAADPGFCGAVLGYLATDEALLLAFAADSGLSAEEIVCALQALDAPPPPGEP